MKRTTILLVVLAFAFSPQMRVLAAEAAVDGADPTPVAPEVYPWSETSPTVRVPKSFLDHIAIRPITITNYETMEFVVTDDCTKIFRLTQDEANKVNQSLSAALHDYRLTEGKHLEPVEDGIDAKLPPAPGRQPALPPATEKFNFRLIPFPDEAVAINQNLRAKVAGILGEQRTTLFWEHSKLMYDGEMKTFRKRPMEGPVQSSTTTYRYTLRSSDPSGVDWYSTTVSLDPWGSRGTSAQGRPYTAPLDRYAPESMKPVLARWRKLIAESLKKNNAEPASTSPVQAKPANSPHEKNSVPQPPDRPSVAENGEPWDDRQAFIDLPKSLLKSLGVPVLIPDEEIFPEAVTLFSLTGAEQTAVRDLYHEMKNRLEQLESAHFKRVKPDENRFVLHPFPEKVAALRAEWTKKLKSLVGLNRGELLDQSIRMPISPSDMRDLRLRKERRKADPKRFLLGMEGPSWLLRGEAQVNIDVTTGVAPDGSHDLQIQWQSEQEGSGSFGGRADQLPERWRHLLTPDVLGQPLSL